MSCENCQFQRHIKSEDENQYYTDTSVTGCGKLNTFDWLNNISDPGKTDIVEIRFKNTRKEFYRNSEGFRIRAGDVVAVEADRGHDIGIISLTGSAAALQYRRKNNGSPVETLNVIYRKAGKHDIDRWIETRELENPVMIKAREIARELGLNMKIGDVEFQGDGTAATFYYTADTRVDFRDLIRIYAKEFNVRINMRQIGARQEAGRIGGIGSCGRELCCSTWRTEFPSVSSIAARKQNLSPNAEKWLGQCGKLKCCLMYELDTYLEAGADFPKELLELETKKGIAYPRRVDILTKTVWYSYDRSSDTGLIPLSTEKIKVIIMMNKKSRLPAGLTETEETVPSKNKD